MINWLKGIFCKKQNGESKKTSPKSIRLLFSIGKDTIELIKHFEGFKSHPYVCSAGVPTIGYGTTEYPDGKKVTLDDYPIKQEEAEKLLKQCLKEKGSRLANFLDELDLKLKNNQFGALLSFIYNVDSKYVFEEGFTMNRALKSKNEKNIAAAFEIYNKAVVNGKKKTLMGLVRRRKAERDLFLRDSLGDS